MKRLISYIPDFITSMNLLCGVIGVVFAFKCRFDMAFYFMLAAAVFDFMDGFVARLLGAYSDLGRSGVEGFQYTVYLLGNHLGIVLESSNVMTVILFIPMRGLGHAAMAATDVLHRFGDIVPVFHVEVGW